MRRKQIKIRPGLDEADIGYEYRCLEEGRTYEVMEEDADGSIRIRCRYGSHTLLAGDYEVVDDYTSVEREFITEVVL